MLRSFRADRPSPAAAPADEEEAEAACASRSHSAWYKKTICFIVTVYPYIHISVKYLELGQRHVEVKGVVALVETDADKCVAALVIRDAQHEVTAAVQHAFHL